MSQNKQRGIYSEFMGDSNSKVIMNSTQGPNPSTNVSVLSISSSSLPKIQSDIKKEEGLKNKRKLRMQQLMQQEKKIKPFETKKETKHIEPETKKDISSSQYPIEILLEPKVMAQYKPPPGKTPRRIEVERKKRLYATQNIEELLLKLGIDYRHYGPHIHINTKLPAYLPLIIFDNTEYEPRDPVDWVKLGTYQPDPNKPPICRVPSKGLFLNPETQTGFWKQCFMSGYDSNSGLFTVEWKDDPDHKTSQLTRLELLFDTEDPFSYSQRILSAHQYRSYCEGQILYNLYIDNMPTEEIEPLRKEQKDRVQKQSIIPFSLLNEVENDHARTMCKIIFDHFLQKSENSALREQLFFQQSIPKKKIKKRGLIDITYGEKKFDDLFTDFYFHSLYTKPEVIQTLVSVTSDCLKVLREPLLMTDLKKSNNRLEEFEAQQMSCIGHLVHYLKETWIPTLKTHIIDGLSTCGKGWFNIIEQTHEVYKYSKIKKLMNRINFMMEDYIRILVQRNLYDYASIFTQATPYLVEVIDTKNVKIVALNNNNQVPSSFSPSSVFSLELMVQNNTVTVMNKLEAYYEIPLFTFEKGLAVLQEIPHIETKVLEQLFWSDNEGKLTTVQREEKWVCELYDNIKQSIQKYLEPVLKYIESFYVYKEFLELDVKKYVDTFAEEHNNYNDVRESINKHRTEMKHINENIPKIVWLGFYSVKNEEVRNYLLDKHQEIISLLLESFADFTRSRGNAIQSRCTTIQHELRRIPKKIESLIQLEDFIEKIPETLNEMKKEINEVCRDFDMLDEFHYRISKDDIRTRWNTFAGPRTVIESVNNVKTVLSSLKSNFYEEMVSNQKNFEQDIIGIETEFNEFFNLTDYSKLHQYATKAKNLDNNFKEALEKCKIFNQHENLFQIAKSDYSRLNKIYKTFEIYSNLWNVASSMDNWNRTWRYDPFNKLNSQYVHESIGSSAKRIQKVVRSSVLLENPPILAIAEKVKADIEEFQPLLPLIYSLRHDGVRPRHWKQLRDQLSLELDHTSDTFSLQQAIQVYHLDVHMDVIVKIGDIAAKEYSIEKCLFQMKGDWKDIEFNIISFPRAKTFIIRKVDKILSLVDEHLVLTHNMLFSPHKEPFLEDINDWKDKLTLVSDILQEWIKLQKLWMHLQPIFDSEDIRKEMGPEYAKFIAIDKTWRLVMNQCVANPHVLSFCEGNHQVFKKFQEGVETLEKVRKQLATFLDSKRRVFPRFYFLSDDGLLHILSQTKDPTRVQPHLSKCFEKLHYLEFTSDNSMIVAMHSQAGERIEFIQPIEVLKKPVELWLKEVENQMRNTLCELIRKSYDNYLEIPRGEWTQKWQGQCVLAASQLHWTRDVEESILNDGYAGIVRCKNRYDEKLQEIVTLVRGSLSYVQRLTINSLIVLDVHSLDVMKNLVNNEVTSIGDFQWISQLRYYIDKDKGNSINLSMVTSSFPYGFEYLGNTERLVITALTDRCYLTLMTSIQLHMGGAPAGPAGTGKTETCRDLAKSAAKQCVVWNCSEALDHLRLLKFFKGLITCGAWTCFDEFNRIEIEVLSVAAQQIATIFNAIREKVTSFIFEDDELFLNQTCSIFITMNPNYVGRTELPDNLKALFRPVSMMIPDYAQIAQIQLYSFGFSESNILSVKIVQTFKLCSEQLSSQDHYDYGMRAVKTVINQAGFLRRTEPDMDEYNLIFRAIRDVAFPKFLKDDIPLFNNIISDLFPTIKETSIEYGFLMDSVIEACLDLELQPIDTLLQKCIELYDTINVRHGLMLVGPTGGGKTQCIQILQRALYKLSDSYLDYLYEMQTTRKQSSSSSYRKQGDNPKSIETILSIPDPKILLLNPKAITMGQLFGFFDDISHEWEDGVLAYSLRMNIPPEDMSNLRKWIVFDGPVDSLWIENINSALDDNKKVCLDSGEALSISENMRILFEVDSLTEASPATVSRCGMIYLDSENLPILTPLYSWLQYNKFWDSHQVLTSLKPIILYYIDLMIIPAITFLRRFCTELVTSVNNNLIQSFLKIFESFIKNMIPDEKEDESYDIFLETLPNNIEPIFLFSLIWSVGSSSTAEGRMKFNNWFRFFIRNLNLNNPPPIDGTVYDYYYNIKSTQWVEWNSTIPAFSINPSMTYSEIIVPTLESIRTTFLIDLLLKNDTNSNVLITGSTGTGKTVIVNQYLRNLSSNISPISFTFSAATSANQIQNLIDKKMVPHRRGVYGPSLGADNFSYFVIFIDDLNMPAKEKYGAQPPIELLRQWMDHHGWYDLDTLEFKQIVNIMFLSAMSPPGGGRNVVSPRLLRHFVQIALPTSDTNCLKLIFSTIFHSFLTNFSPVIISLEQATVESSIEVYRTISESMLPTPSKSHYTFNLRDLSKVFQGLLNGDPRKITSPQAFLRLWIHENQRVFKDRLISREDGEKFDQMLAQIIEKHFGLSWPEIVTHTPIVFADFMGGLGADIHNYNEISNKEQIEKIISEFLLEYNNEDGKQPMNLVLFLDAIEHVSRISRILRQPLGNALLLGVGGSGRQSLTRLAAYINEYELFQVTVTRNYSKQEWLDDIKKCLMMAGIEEKSTVFLFSDTQISHDYMLEHINNILNSGDVPNLCNNEDFEEIKKSCTYDCQRKGIPPTPINLYAQFVHRVRQNLHIVLCMNPIGELFRQRLRMFPSLTNCSTIDWFFEWPTEALRCVAANQLAEEDLKLDNVSSIVDICVNIHQSVEVQAQEFFNKYARKIYVTPTSYLELLFTFQTLLKLKRDEVDILRLKLRNGLYKLEHTADNIKELEQEIIKLKPQLDEKEKIVAQMVENTKLNKKAEEETEAEMLKEEEKLLVINEEAKKVHEEAVNALKEAEPALNEAIKCLSQLDKSDIDELRVMRSPPQGVLLTMEICCIMFQRPPEKNQKKLNPFWVAALKHFLNRPNEFLTRLTEYPRDNIPPHIIKQIEPYMHRPDFTVEAIANASKAAKFICVWVKAMYNYDRINKEIEPLRKKKRECESNLEITEKVLQDSRHRLTAIKERIVHLEKEYENRINEKKDYEERKAECEKKVKNAVDLIEGLGGEKDRWKEKCDNLEIAFSNLCGDVVLSSGIIAYLGPFSMKYRDILITEWEKRLDQLNISHSENFSLHNTLGDPVQIRMWNSNNLPHDKMSEENAIIMNVARRWPLMIDPQGQANKFIKKLEQNYENITLSDKDYITKLENAIQWGRPIILENIEMNEEIDASIYPILLQNYIMIDNQKHIKFNDKTLIVNELFKFYITTRASNPYFPPELQVQVTLLNFSLTKEGCADQMLGIVVGKEAPELENKKGIQVKNNNKKRSQIRKIENKILELLNETKDEDILLDDALINVLKDSKVKSKELTTNLADSLEIEKEIDNERMRFQIVAERTATLFFCISDLAIIDIMYQYSLSWFVTLFLNCISESPASSPEDRMKVISDYFTITLYQNVCRSLFEEHKLLFSLLICVSIMRSEKRIDPLEWRHLVASPAPSKNAPNPASAWLTEKAWSDILALTDLSVFYNFDQDFVKNLNHFKNYFDSTQPHLENLPQPWQTILTDLQKMLVLNCLRPDKMVLAIQNFVSANIGKEFVDIPPFDLRHSFDSSTVTTPLIFVLSPGADPCSQLKKFASEMGFAHKLTVVSMGKGQGEYAKRVIRSSKARGGWVLLENCHLALSWLPTLGNIVELIDPEEVDPNFRLWLTSMPNKNFPASILQASVKMVNELPKGLRANMLRCYNTFNENELLHNTNPQAFNKLLFSLCFFHSLILDRRKFSTLGWNIPYQFTDQDLNVAISQLRIFIEMFDYIPYKVIHFLTSEIHYGGRITDDIDRLTIRTILDDFICPEIMEDNYKFSPSGIYTSIPIGDLQYYLNVIKAYPVIPNPEIFSLNENADITCAIEETQKLLGSCLNLLPRESSGVSNWGMIIEMTKNILNKIPNLIEFDYVKKKYPTKYSNSMNTVLVQETIRYNRLLSVINKTLNNLLKGITGEIVMNHELEKMSQSIYNNQVPDNWVKYSYPSLMPLNAYIQDLCCRLSFINKWIENGAPSVFWISGFFFPQAFLTGTRQDFARKYKFPIDQVFFSFRIIDKKESEISSPPPDGVYIKGLFMEGARFSSEESSILDSRPKELFTPMPIIWLLPQKNISSPNPNIYHCPVYKTLSRAGELSTTGHSSNFILHIDLPTKQPPKKWIKAGVAMFTALRWSENPS